MATSTQPALCNCYAYVRSKIPSLPLASELKGNSTPQKGAVVIFEYIVDGEVVPHYAILRTFEGDGFWVDENNYKKCVTNPRYIRWDYPRIRGFWVPTDQTQH
jgi:hypothetical protein